VISVVVAERAGAEHRGRALHHPSLSDVSAEEACAYGSSDARPTSAVNRCCQLDRCGRLWNRRDDGGRVQVPERVRNASLGEWRWCRRDAVRALPRSVLARSKCAQRRRRGRRPSTRLFTRASLEPRPGSVEIDQLDLRKRRTCAAFVGLSLRALSRGLDGWTLASIRSSQGTLNAATRPDARVYLALP